MGCNPKFDAVLTKMAAIHDKKSEDYASAENRYSNFEFSARVAALFTDPLDQVFAALIGVKLARLGELRSKGKTPNHESVQDTRIDLANYAALWASYHETPAPAIDFQSLFQKILPIQPGTAGRRLIEADERYSTRGLLDTRKVPVMTSGYITPVLTGGHPG